MKSTCNIMNKMQDERETQTKFSTWRKKTVIPYICRSIFQTNYPIANYYKFHKNTNPLQADIQKNQTITPILGSYPLLNLQDLPFFKARIRYNGDLQITTIHNHLIQKLYLSWTVITPQASKTRRQCCQIDRK